MTKQAKRERERERGVHKQYTAHADADADASKTSKVKQTNKRTNGDEAHADTCLKTCFRTYCESFIVFIYSAFFLKPMLAYFFDFCFVLQ